MNHTKNPSLHYWILAGLMALGAALRFWHLGFKPLWLDEVLTALISLGHRYRDVPLEVVFSSAQLHELFTLQPDRTCAEIAQTLATESTHPPLFFCLMHQWLTGLESVAQPLSWKLRALPAMFGVGAIAAIYLLNRIAFSPAAGLMGAALMAVSPFAVYLSQEARHYTLPMLLVILALLGLMQIQQSFYFKQQQPKPLLWVLWGIVNSLGCYIHYFFILAFIAQLLTLTGLMYWRRRMVATGSWYAVILVVIGVAVSYLPWLPKLLGSFGRQETTWLPKPQHLAPLFQTLAGWFSMVIALPVENQPLSVQLPAILLTITLGIWVGWQGWRGFKPLWQNSENQIAILTLSGFTLFVLLQFGGIIYGLGKDITVAPRYNFVYFPALCALLGASFTSRLRVVNLLNWRLGVRSQESGVRSQGRKIFWARFVNTIRQPATILLSISLVSCIFVVSNLAFLKSFHPQQVARDMNLEPSIPMMMVVGYHNFQDVALGLSFALAIDSLPQRNSATGTNASFAFFNPQQSSHYYESVWQKLAQLPELSVPRLNLWVVAPGLRRREYPQKLEIGVRTRCTIDPSQHYRIGIPYQLYRCVLVPRG